MHRRRAAAAARGDARVPPRPGTARGRGGDLTGAPPRTRQEGAERTRAVRRRRPRPARAPRAPLGDTDAIRRLAPAAARAASAGRGHRQALAHWEAALEAAGGDDIEALEGITNEAYLCGSLDQAVEAARAVLAHYEGDALKKGDALRWLSRVLWWSGQGEQARAAGDEAIEVLEAFPDSRELAMAIAPARSWRCCPRTRRSRSSSACARSAARKLDDAEIMSHGLTNLGPRLLPPRSTASAGGP